MEIPNIQSNFGMYIVLQDLFVNEFEYIQESRDELKYAHATYKNSNNHSENAYWHNF